jgi:hypothetical protein
MRCQVPKVWGSLPFFVRQAIANTLQYNGEDLTSSSKIAIKGAAGKITTLTGAMTAQNLAVFLKKYSDWL